MTAAFLRHRRDNTSNIVYEGNVWTWHAYPPHEWRYEDEIGWHNIDDDPATPTEGSLLDRIAELEEIIVGLGKAELL